MAARKINQEFAREGLLTACRRRSPGNEGRLAACRRLLALTVMLFWAQCAAALDPARTIFQLKHSSWTAEAGAPVGVTSIAQTADGYLWLGSGSGLVRFDGVKFEQFDEISDARLPHYDVYALWAPPSGGLWIGFALGGATFFKDGHATNFGDAQGLSRGSISAFAEDSGGRLWAGTGDGLARFDGSRWHMAGSLEHYAAGSVNRLHLDTRGTLWVQADGALAVLRRKSSVFEDLGIHGKYPMIAEAPDGTIYESDTESGIRRVRELGHGSIVLEPPLHEVKQVIPNVDRSGGLWITTDSGLFHFGRPAQLQPLGKRPSAVEHFDKKDGLSGDFVSAYFEDREGNIWIATNGGLDRFRYANIVHVALPPGREFFALAPVESGGVWVGNQNAPGLLKVTGDLAADQRWPAQVSCAFTDRDGTAWIAGNTGVWRSDHGHWVLIARPPPWTQGSPADVQAMARDQSGALWVSYVNHGLYRWFDGEWKENGGISGFPNKRVVSEADDATGRVWFGYQGNQIAVLDGATLRVFGTADGLSIGTVLAFANRGKHVWAGGELGLARFDDKHFHPVLVPGLGSAKQISGIVETQNGDLWLNGNAGVVRITSTDLERNAIDARYPVRAELFDTRDGLPGKANTIRPLPSAVQGSDGRIWFATDYALAWVDPGALYRNPVAPPTWIQSIESNGHRQSPSASLDFPPGTRNLQISYTALSLPIPERVRFRYRLQGFDDTWQEAAGRRVAYYTNLAPGHYKFEVIAANESGVWNDAGDAIAFSIRPAFFQTSGFLLLCGAAGILGLYLLYRSRTRQLVAESTSRLEERLFERERIARDLHDTLLQNVQGLVYRFQAVANRLPPSDPHLAILEEELNQADEVIGQCRGILTGMRDTATGTGDLSDELIAHGARLTRDRAIAVKTVIQGTPKPLHPVVFEEVLRIGKEALTNAFQHSAAGQIELELVYERHEFSMRVRDDGVGFDALADRPGDRPGHFGLLGMRERAARIRSKVDVWSRSGAGTEIAVRVPAAMAYQARNRVWRWR